MGQLGRGQGEKQPFVLSLSKDKIGVVEEFILAVLHHNATITITMASDRIVSHKASLPRRQRAKTALKAIAAKQTRPLAGVLKGIKTRR
jgi:hypothetical protein